PSRTASATETGPRSSASPSTKPVTSHVGDDPSPATSARGAGNAGEPERRRTAKACSAPRRASAGTALSTTRAPDDASTASQAPPSAPSPSGRTNRYPRGAPTSLAGPEGSERRSLPTTNSDTQMRPTSERTEKIIVFRGRVEGGAANQFHGRRNHRHMAIGRFLRLTRGPTFE